MCEQCEEYKTLADALKQQLAEAQELAQRLTEDLGSCELCDRDLVTIREDGSRHNCICLACWNAQVTRTQKAEAELARFRAAEAGMPKLRRMKVSTDGSKPLSVEFYDDADVKALHARCVALEAKMQGKVLVPEEPTEEMLEDACDAFEKMPKETASLGEIITSCYKAALAAAKRGEEK